MKKNHKKVTKVWTTKDGSKIRICDMDDNHLVNTLKMLQRNARAHKINCEVFYLTCERPNGDMANLAFDQEADAQTNSTWEDVVLPIFWDMLKEAERRRIKVEFPDTAAQDLGIVAHTVLKLDTKKKLRKLKQLRAEEERIEQVLGRIIWDGREDNYC